MNVNEEQIKNYLGLFRILFSEEEIKEIIKGEDSEFVKTVVDKIDKFLAQTFKEIKMKDKCKSVKIYYVMDMKELKGLKKIILDNKDYEILNNPEIQDPHKKIFDKYLGLLSKDDKKEGYYIGVFEDVKGSTVRTVSGVINWHKIIWRNKSING